MAKASTRPWVVLAVLAQVAMSARADVLHVPQDFPDPQSAVDAALPGDEIVVAGGTYEGLLVIANKTDLRLRGAGTVEFVGSVAGEPNVLVDSSTGIVIDHLRVSGSEGDGIKVLDSAVVTVLRCRIDGSAGHGLHISGGHDVRAERVIVTGSGGDGLRVEDADSVTLDRCRAAGDAGTGLRIADGTGHRVERCRVDDAGNGGLVMGSGPGPTVVLGILRDCVVRGGPDFGLAVNGDSVLVEGNRVFDAGTFGLAVTNGTGGLVRDNRVVRAAVAGLIVSDGTHEVLDNRVIQCGQDGFIVSGNLPVVLAGNRVVKAGGDGLVVQGTSNGTTLADNRVTAPAGVGLRIVADDVQATGNRVQGAGADGVRVSGAGGVFVDNRASGSASFDLFDTSGGGNTYADNHFTTTHFE